MAEIAIMNMKGIALATSRKEQSARSNLFQLSNHHPVGIMVYGKPNYLRVPWEIFIKIYRDQLEEKHFTTLEQYVADFLSFIDNSNYADFQNEEAEAQFAYDALNNEVKILAADLSQIKRELATHSKDDITTEYQQHAEALITDRLNVLEKDYINAFADSDFRIMTKKFDESIDQMMDTHFEESLLNKSWRGKIKTIVCSNVLKNFTNYSRLVFAGFGENELFPSVITVMIEGKINGKLKYAASSNLSKSVNATNPVYIVPLNEASKVDALTTGIDERMEDFSLTSLGTMLGSMETKLIDQFKTKFKEDIDLEAVKEVIHNELIDVYQTYNQAVFEFKQSEYVQPLTDKLNNASKEALTEMATTFSNLNKEIGESTTDVAVITKGDGFHWAKPKGF
ncbi:MAG TPA: hypothetical protein VK094_09480 [Pseudogracilibacillus sp.]|nr:hypothetical protein [Pseudogracilibacillus sp.]